MPIMRPSARGVLPAASRKVDIARKTIDRMLPSHIERYTAAFKVQGYTAIIYNYLNSGIACSCKGNHDNGDGADSFGILPDGKATVGLLNTLLTNGQSFGIEEYGVTSARVPGLGYKKIDGGIEIFPSANKKVAVKERDVEPTLPHDPNLVGTAFDYYSEDIDNPNANTIVPDTTGDDFDEHQRSVLEEEAGITEEDLENLISRDEGATDSVCAVCFGTGFVGGFSLYNGHRIVINHQWPAILLHGGYTDTEEDTPTITNTNTISFDVVLPRMAYGIDAFRALNKKSVLKATFVVDGVAITKEHDLLSFCDGLTHNIKVTIDGNSLTHVEIQLYVSKESAYVEFPRLTDGDELSKLDGTSDVSILLPPTIPLIRKGDLIIESTRRKVFKVRSVTDWHTQRHQIMGWDAETTVMPINTLYSLLPKRAVLQSPLMVRRIPYAKDAV